MVDPAPAITALPELVDVIDGDQLAPEVAQDTWLCDPNSGAPFQRQRATGDEQIERALAAAAAAYARGDWADLSTELRAAWLERIADELEARQPELAVVEALTTGVVLSQASLVTAVCALTFRAAASMLRASPAPLALDGKHGPVEVWRRGWGPAALIVPWNAPAALAAHKIASALAAGCPVILKPSEWAAHSCDLLAAAVVATGLPRGVFQLVHGDGAVGARLVADPRIRAVSFTGGLAGGRAVARACAEGLKPLQLELGGNNPLIVLEDADLDLAALGVVSGLTTLNGQWCRALGRLLVHADCHDALLERVAARLAQLRIGHSCDAASAMGPLIHAGHHRVVSEAVRRLEAHGGTARSTSPLPDLAGHFFAPALITGCDPCDTLEEIFGPVAAVHRFSGDAEALALANQSPYGLAGYIFSADEARARAVARQIRAGDVKINGVSLIGLHPLAPRAAWGLSGLGEEGVAATFEFFRGTRVVGRAA